MSVVVPTSETSATPLPPKAGYTVEKGVTYVTVTDWAGNKKRIAEARYRYVKNAVSSGFSGGIGGGDIFTQRPILKAPPPTPGVSSPGLEHSTMFASLINSAASIFGVPKYILWGVYGVESNFGQDTSTSSAGAEGPFQFLPSTWAAYSKGHPPASSNKPPIQDVGVSAWVAAKYLRHLYDTNGHSWDKALRSYSGGGYGLSEVQAKAKQHGEPVPASEAVDASIKVPGVGDILGALLNAQTWLRVLEAVGGVALLFLALRELTGM